MKVLINAYACSPTWGSEPGMGWNWITNLAKYAELFIITEGEWENEIKESLENHPYKYNLHFYFLPVPDKVRKMCWNQGDWRFYYYYDKWQKRALSLAREIVDKEKIDVIHQLNMVGFREPGYLWKLDKPLVWGPIGGMDNLPFRYLEKAPFSQKVMLYLKNTISSFQLRYNSKINKAFDKASVVIAAVPAVQEKVWKVKKKKCIFINETGCYDQHTAIPDKRNRKDFHVLWVGRFLYTKRLDIALKAIAMVKDLPGLHFHIVGTGSDREIKNYKSIANNLEINDICIWHGKVDNPKVHEMMRMSDIFFFTSIMEATSTVIPEAINNGLPILCFNTCGFGPIVTDEIGKRVEMTAPEESILIFSKELRNLYNNKELLHQMSENCKKTLKGLLWVNKAEKVSKIYGEIL